MSVQSKHFAVKFEEGKSFLERSAARKAPYKYTDSYHVKQRPTITGVFGCKVTLMGFDKRSHKAFRNDAMSIMDRARSVAQNYKLEARPHPRNNQKLPSFRMKEDGNFQRISTPRCFFLHAYQGDVRQFLERDDYFNLMAQVVSHWMVNICPPHEKAIDVYFRGPRGWSQIRCSTKDILKLRKCLFWYRIVMCEEIKFSPIFDPTYPGVTEADFVECDLLPWLDTLTENEVQGGSTVITKYDYVMAEAYLEYQERVGPCPPKTPLMSLNEICQRLESKPQWTESRVGPDHQPQFTTTLTLNYSTAEFTALSKQDSRQCAAALWIMQAYTAATCPTPIGKDVLDEQELVCGVAPDPMPVTSTTQNPGKLITETSANNPKTPYAGVMDEIVEKMKDTHVSDSRTVYQHHQPYEDPGTPFQEAPPTVYDKVWVGEMQGNWVNDGPTYAQPTANKIVQKFTRSACLPDFILEDYNHPPRRGVISQRHPRSRDGILVSLDNFSRRYLPSLTNAGVWLRTFYRLHPFMDGHIMDGYDFIYISDFRGAWKIRKDGSSSDLLLHEFICSRFVPILNDAQGWFTDMFDKIKQSASTLKRSMDHLSVFDQFMQQATATLQGDAFRFGKMLLNLCSTFYLVFRADFTWDVVLAAIVSWVTALATDIQMVLKISRQILACFVKVWHWIVQKKENAAEGDDGDDVDEKRTIFTSITSMIYSAYSMVYPELQTTSKHFWKVVGGLAILGRGIIGINQLIEFVPKAFNYVLTKIYGFIFRNSPVECSVTYSEWVAIVQELTAIQVTRDMIRDRDLVLKIETCYRDGLIIGENIGGSTDKALMIQYSQMMHAISTVWKSARSLGATPSYMRSNPLVIYLHGAPATGKTTCGLFLAGDLIRPYSKDIENNLYIRNPAQDFWDNYRGQIGCWYDDFGQIKDTDSNPNPEYQELIRNNNICPHPLHSATIEEKGKVFFDSKFVLLTSNVGHVKTNVNSITCYGAFARRLNIVAQVDIDETLFPDGFPDKVDPRAYKFTLQRLEKDSTLSTIKTLNYEQFTSFCTMKLKETINNSAEVQDIIKEHMLKKEPVPDFKEKYGDLFSDLESYKSVSPELSLYDEEEDDEEDWTPQDSKQLAYYKRKAKELKKKYVKGKGKNSAPKADDDFGFFDARSTQKKTVNEAEGGYNECQGDPEPGYSGLENPAKFKSRSFNIDDLDYDVCEDIRCKFTNGHITVRIESKKETQDQIVGRLRIFTSLNQGINILPDFCHLAQHDPDATLITQERVHKLVVYPTGDALIRTRNDRYAWFSKLLGLTAILGSLIAILWKTGKLEKASTKVKGWWKGVRSCHLRNVANQYMDAQLTPEVAAEIMGTSMCRWRCSLCSYVKKRNIPTSVGEDAMGQCAATVLTRCGEYFDHEKVVEEARAGIAQLPPKSEAEAISGDHYTKAATKNRVEANEAEAASDPQAYEIRKKVGNNLVYVTVHSTISPEYRVTGLCLNEHYLLLPGHLESVLAPGAQLTIVFCGAKEPLVINYDEITDKTRLRDEDGDKDAIVIRVPKMHAMPSVIDTFVTREEQGRFTATPGVLIHLSQFKGYILPSTIGLPNVIARDRQGGEPYVDKYGSYKIRKYYEYSAETVKGMCGSLVTLTNTAITGKLMGFHVFGNSSTHLCGAVKLCREELERFKYVPVNSAQGDDRLMPIVIQMPDDTQEGVDGQLPDGAHFVPLGKSPDTYTSSGKTQIFPSPLHDRITEHVSEPAVLKPVKVFDVNGCTLVDPLMKALKKAGPQPQSCDGSILEDAVRSYKVKLFQNCPSERRILTLKEAIKGIEGDPYMGRLNPKSSAGYRWSKKGKVRSGKYEWFGVGEDDYVHKDLKETVEKRLEELKQGHLTRAVWIDSLKDERRDLERVSQAKTRVFSAAQMDFSIIVRMYFLDFVKHVMRNRIDNEIAIGINVYSGEWTRLAHHLQQKGDKVFAGDFSNYDGTLVNDINWRILDLINEWYDDGPENALVRRTLFYDIVSSVHVCGNQLYGWTHSQPSGNPLTAVINSMYNSISMRYVFAIETGRDMADFNQHIAMISYGDDNGINVSDEISDEFNQNVATNGYQKLGMTYTDESKSCTVEATRHLKDITFLKRHFVWREGRCYAPRDVSSILETLNWVRGKVEHNELCRMNCEDAAFELAICGREIYEEWTPKIWKASLVFLPYNLPEIPRYEILLKRLHDGY